VIGTGQISWYAERSSDGRLFQAEGPTVEKALCCLIPVVSMWYHEVTSGG